LLKDPTSKIEFLEEEVEEKELKEDQVVMRLGGIHSSSYWEYISGKKDSICFKVSKEIVITGCGICNTKKATDP